MLREELARRFEVLAEAYTATEGAPTPDALRRVYADECIRQMEWARRFCADPHEYEGALSGQPVPLRGDPSLCLAPDGWQATQDAIGAPE